MTTQQTDWVEYTGSDEQIAELKNAKDGVCLIFEHSKESFVYSLEDISTVNGVPTLSNTVTHYLICKPHQHAKMIRQWAFSGQPVWIRQSYCDPVEDHHGAKVFVTTTPNWNIPNAEYSFAPFD